MFLSFTAQKVVIRLSFQSPKMAIARPVLKVREMRAGLLEHGGFEEHESLKTSGEAIQSTSTLVWKNSR
jgi:hypothetical protein